MVDLIIFVAIVAFATAGVLAAITKSWAVALIAFGLALVTIAETGVIKG